jgi:hypothetical protein
MTERLEPTPCSDLPNDNHSANSDSNGNAINLQRQAQWTEYRHWHTESDLSGPLLTLADIAEQLDVSTANIVRLLTEGRIKGVWKVDPQTNRSRWYTTLEEVQTYQVNTRAAMSERARKMLHKRYHGERS